MHYHGIPPIKRGRKATAPLLVEIVRLEKDLARTQEKLRQAEFIIAAQKKIADLMTMWETQNNNNNNNNVEAKV